MANALSIQNNTDAFQPDMEEARYFLQLLDPRGVFTFQTFTDPKPTPKPDPLAKAFHGTLDEHYDDLTALNRRGAGVFIMVNEGDGEIHEGEKSCRTNRNVVRVRAFYVDLDGAPLDAVQAAALPPHIIVASSPGRWHAYWLVSDASIEDFSRTQKRLIARFNADPSVHDLARVMRLPGFFHRKGEPFQTHVVFPKKAAK